MTARVIAATDGSAAPTNPGPAGYAWYVDEERWGAGGSPEATNNRAELAAVLALFRATAAENVPLHILIDSQYVIGALGTNRAHKNKDLIDQLRAAAEGRDYTVEWVRGHTGHPLNEAADTLCSAAAAAMHQGQPVNEGPGWSSRVQTGRAFLCGGTPTSGDLAIVAQLAEELRTGTEMRNNDRAN